MAEAATTSCRSRVPRVSAVGRTRCQLPALVALALVVLVAVAAPASAHTGFESSDPADGATVTTAVEKITIRFTNEAEPAGDAFVVLDPRLGERAPTTVDEPEVGVFVLGFDPPINNGRVGVRWTVRAPDAHPINGSFSFTVEAPADTSAPSDPDPSGNDVDAFLTTDSTTQWGRTVANVGRFLAMGGMMVALGFITFALTVVRGTRPELRMLLFWIRRAAVVVVVGTVLDAAGQVVFEAGDGAAALVDPGAHADVLASSLGLALLLRLGGAVVVAGGARISMVHARTGRDVLASVTAHVPIGAGSTRVADHPRKYWDDHDVAWDLDRHGFVAALGFVLLLASHAFDGHTVTEGSRFLTGVASGLHVLAAAVWAGGVGALALLIRRRSRRAEPTHSLVMVARYSVVATVALCAVAVLGVYLAFVILDAPSELWSTAWGRWFVAKTALVTIAAGIGAHNHHIIVPALEAAEEDDATVARLRRTLRNEVIVLTAVTVLTALLVRAASTLD